MKNFIKLVGLWNLVLLIGGTWAQEVNREAVLNALDGSMIRSGSSSADLAGIFSEYWLPILIVVVLISMGTLFYRIFNAIGHEHKPLRYIPPEERKTPSTGNAVEPENPFGEIEKLVTLVDRKKPAFHRPK